MRASFLGDTPAGDDEMVKSIIIPIFCVLVFCVGLPARAQVSRGGFSAVEHQHVRVVLDDDTQVQGEVRAIGAASAIIVADDGEVREVPFESVTRLFVTNPSDDDLPRDDAVEALQSADAAVWAAIEAARTGTRARNTAEATARSEAREATQMFAISPYARASARLPARTPGGGRILVLKNQDYVHYQAMMDASKFKRTMGWSLAAAGALLFVTLAAQVHRAHQWGMQPRVAELAVMASLTTVVGWPLAFVGRHQYREARDFAREAAQGREAIHARRKTRTHEEATTAGSEGVTREAPSGSRSFERESPAVSAPASGSPKPADASSP